MTETKVVDIQDTLEEISAKADATITFLAHLFDSDLINNEKRRNTTAIVQSILDIVIDREDEIKKLANAAIQSCMAE